MTGSGIDTCSIAYRPEREGFFDALLSRPHRPTAMGGVTMVERGPGETVIGAFPKHGIVWWEGRVDALLRGRRDAWNLRPKADLQEADDVARQAVEEVARHRLGSPDWCTDGELRRYDLAHELEFEGQDGLAFLRTLRGMHAPRRVIDSVTGADGHVQTVYWRTPKRFVVTERVYDKGVESGSHPAGERVRIEAQRRPPKSLRRRPGVVARLDLSADFSRTMQPYLGAENVIAAGSNATTEHLAGAVARGEISMARAERMIGSVELLRIFGRSVYSDDRQARRRLQGLREAGVALDAELPPDRVVPVGQLLRDAVESFGG